PCPCGSGKKFKKCCEGKETEEVAPKAVASGYEDAEQLPARELVKLDLRRVPLPAAILALRRFGALGLWDRVERALHALASRGDVPDLEGYRLEMLEDAIDARAKDAARRLAEGFSDDAVLAPVTRLDLAFLDDEPLTISEL